jgi:hypothetical protein
MRKMAILAVLLLAASAAIPAGAFGDDGQGQGHPSGRAVQRTTLFELFTNVNNTDTADDENATARIASEFARSRLAILEWFEAGSPLAAPESQERFNYYGILSPLPLVPIGEVDGTPSKSNTNNDTQTYTTYHDAISAAVNVTPSADITGTASLNGLNGSVNATINFTTNMPSTGLYVYCFLYEDSVNYKGANNVTYHRFVARKQAGRYSFPNGPITSGDRFFANYSFSLDPSWNKANMGAIVAVQSEALHTMHQCHLYTFSAGALYAVDMSPPDQSTELSAGKTAQVFITARNNGTATDTLDFSTTGPASSWASLSRSSATLAPGEPAQLTVTVIVPAGTAAGQYLINIKGVSRSDPSKSDEAAIHVTVKEELVYGVSLSPGSAQEEVNAGDSASFRIMVKNTGSLNDTVDLTVLGTQASWGSLSKAAISLPPNGEEAVTLTVSVPSETDPGRYDFTVKGTSRGDSTKTESSAAAVNVIGQSAASFGVDIQPRQMTRALTPGDSAMVSLTVNNTGNTNDTFDLSKTGDASSWALLEPLSMPLDASGQGTVTVDISVPASATASRYTLTVRATSRGDSTKRSDSVITIDISIPEEPPKIDMVSRTPDKPTSKEVVIITLVTSGTASSYAEITYTEGAVSHAAQKMAKSGNTFTSSIGPFKADTLVKYTVTAYTASGKSNRSAEYSFTVKAAPASEQPTPGFGALAAVIATGAIAIVVWRRRR